MSVGDMSELDLGKMKEGARAADQTDWFGPDELWAHGFIGTYNSAHIANCDPPAILALIDRVEKAEAEQDTMREALSRIQLMISVDEDNRELSIIRSMAVRAYEFKPGRDAT